MTTSRYAIFISSLLRGARISFMKNLDLIVIAQSYKDNNFSSTAYKKRPEFQGVIVSYPILLCV